MALQLDPVTVGPLLADPLIGQQYSLDRMAVYGAWNAGARGEGVVVAVVDSGVDFNHPDLAGVFVSRGHDFINNDDDATDDAGHGTHVAGIIAMRPDNGIGGAGVAYGARILPVKVMGADGSGNHSTIAQGVVWAADNGAKIINLSLGGLYPSQTMEAAIAYAAGKGALIVASAGNHGTTQPAYPAAYPQVVSVCATDHGDRRATYSAYGETVDVCAPGSDIVSTVRGNGWQAWSGTSMSSPAAAAVAALIWSRYPAWDAAAVRGALLGTAEAVVDVGSGRVNATRGVGAQPVPAPTVAPTATAQPTNDPATVLENLINDYRRANGLPALRHDARLRQAGHVHNIWMRDHGCFDHNCPGEADVLARMRSTGYPVTSGGENIGRGFADAQAQLNGWKASAGHNAALLNSYWPDIGCAWLDTPGGPWASCEFAKGSDFVPIPTSAPLPTRTATPVSRPPLPTAAPMPTATPDAPPAEYTMVIHFPYRGLGWNETNWLYQTFCVGWRSKGVWCQWVRE